MKTTTIKKPNKQTREQKVLLGLVEYYIKTGKPVGSHTLKEAGFEDLSSATIRNYFAHLEEEGYLSQQHASGGRIPTELAYRLYSREFIDSKPVTFEGCEQILLLKKNETQEVTPYLQKAAELLSSLSSTAVFLSAPRFDQDFVLDIKFVSLDHNRCLGILISNFGIIQTEVLHTAEKLSTFSVKRIEKYLQSRLKNQPAAEELEKNELALAREFYNELMVRYIVGYSNFSNEEIYRTGFSKLLAFSDFTDPLILANSLSLFENAQSMRILLRESVKANELRYWIGSDLLSFSAMNVKCAVLTIPYYINQKPVGAVGLLGPLRIPYRQLFSMLRLFSLSISEALTQILYKYKIHYREPKPDQLGGKKCLPEQNPLILLEDKRNAEYFKEPNYHEQS